MPKESINGTPDIPGVKIIFEDQSLLDSLKRDSNKRLTRLEHYMCSEHITMVNNNMEELAEELVEEGELAAPFWFVSNRWMN